MSPDWNAYVRRNLPPLGLRGEREADVIAELVAQFEQAYQDALLSGLDREQAVRRAEQHVIDWTQLARELKAANVPVPDRPRPEVMWHDVRYALRALRLNPMFAAIAIVTLAFGIGGNTAIFTVVDHIALRGLPYPSASRLINIEHTKADQPEIDPWCAIDNFLEFRKRSRTLASIAGISPLWNVVISGDGDTERLEALYVSADFFPMLGVKPAAGRFFTDQEDDRVQPVRLAVLSHGFWTRRFGGSADVIGKTLRIDGAGVTVIGVLPGDFRWVGEPLTGTTSTPDLWMPLASNSLARSPRVVRFLKVTGQLQPGVTVEQGKEEIRRIGAELTAEFADANRNLSFAGATLESRTTGRMRPAVYLLLGTVGFVLLMASANVANLLLARAAARQREIAVRVALGASSLRIMRQLLTESAVLAIFGGVLGVAMALGLLRLILAYGPAAMLNGGAIALDGRALLFTSGVVLLSAVMAGFAPAWRAVSGNISDTVRQGRGYTVGNRRLRAALVTGQMAIALVLLIGSGLLIRSFLRVLMIDPGFDPRNLVSIATQVPPGSTPEQRMNLFNAIRDRLRATPAVINVGGVSRLPMLAQNLTSLLEIEGQESAAHPPEVESRIATPDYFRTMGIPLRAGALFDDRNASLLIDELTAQRHLAGVDPVGKRVRFLADRNRPWFTIVGVVGTTRQFGLEADPRPTIYRAAALSPLSNPFFVIRTAGDPAALMPVLTHIVRTTHGNMPAYNVFAMEKLVDRSTAERRFLMWLLTAFAIGGLLLAGVGVYGAISQSVAQRTREIGVRIALGASPGSVLGLVFGECLRIAGIGVAVGLVVAWIGARIGQRLLFQVRPNDALVFAVAVVTLLVFGAVACYIPARRATRVDPLCALRQD